jgi:hypothetical protein
MTGKDFDKLNAGIATRPKYPDPNHTTSVTMGQLPNEPMKTNTHVFMPPRVRYPPDERLP